MVTPGTLSQKAAAPPPAQPAAKGVPALRADDV
jgi:hypothetical protein